MVMFHVGVDGKKTNFCDNGRIIPQLSVTVAFILLTGYFGTIYWNPLMGSLILRWNFNG